jgi:segregation and condensation protein A
MAATLMLIKSRLLLPVEEREEMEEEEADPRWDLVRQLVEYKKFKDAAARLEGLELRQENIFGGGGRLPEMEPEDPGVVLHEIGLFDLIAAFNDVLKRVEPEVIGEIQAETFTVADKIDVILNRTRSQETVSFHSLFASAASRHEIVCTFLALLELIRLRQIDAVQNTHFGDIDIVAVPETVEA